MALGVLSGRFVRSSLRVRSFVRCRSALAGITSFEYMVSRPNLAPKLLPSHCENRKRNRPRSVIVVRQGIGDVRNYLGHVLHLQRRRVHRVDVARRPAVVVHAIALDLLADCPKSPSAPQSRFLERDALRGFTPVNKSPMDDASHRDRLLHLSEDTVIFSLT